MSPARTVQLITAREVGDRLRSKAYAIGTLVFVLAVGAGVLIAGLLRDGGPTTYTVGVVGDVPASFGETLAATTAAQDLAITLVDSDSRDTAATAVGDEDVDAALIGGTQLMVDGAPPNALRLALEAALQQSQAVEGLQAAGVSGQELEALARPRPPLVVVDPAGAGEEGMFGSWVVAFAMIIVLFTAVSGHAGSLLAGAIEEKSSRVIEVLLGSVRPWQLLAAKIIALTGLTLAQVGLIVGAALGANAVAGTFQLPPATAPTLAVALVMLVIGFVFYAALYTVAGSLASTAEDAQGSAGPLTFLVMAAYFLVILAVLPSPQGLWAQVLSYVPATAPFTVPARVALDAMPLWQAGIAAAVTLGGVVLTVALAARLYSASLLASGKLTWRQAWRSEPIG